MPLSAHSRNVMLQSCTDAQAVEEIAGILNASLDMSGGGSGGGGSLPQPLAPTDSPTFAAVTLGAGGVVINGKRVVGVQQQAITQFTVTASAGTLPPYDGGVQIANANTPTVQELLKFCVSLQTTQWYIINVLQQYGLTA